MGAGAGGYELGLESSSSAPVGRGSRPLGDDADPCSGGCAPFGLPLASPPGPVPGKEVPLPYSLIPGIELRWGGAQRGAYFISCHPVSLGVGEAGKVSQRTGGQRGSAGAAVGRGWGGLVILVRGGKVKKGARKRAVTI